MNEGAEEQPDLAIAYQKPNDKWEDALPQIGGYPADARSSRGGLLSCSVYMAQGCAFLVLISLHQFRGLACTRDFVQIVLLRQSQGIYDTDHRCV